MSFNVLTIRSGLSAGDGALYPMLSDTSSSQVIALEEYDGSNVSKLVATAVQVCEVREGGLKTLLRLREVKIDVYITDGRLALACEKYDKGGSWVGFGGAGALVALTANAVSKARAAGRSRGKVLVGHIRYPWLKSVGATSKTGVGSNEAIRLEYAEKLPNAMVRKIIELTLPKNIDATLVAEEIARRAVAFRLANYPSMRHDERAKFADLSQDLPKLQPAPKKFAFVHMPTYYPASARTAYPRLPQSEAAARDQAGTPAEAAGPADPIGPTERSGVAAVTSPADLDVHARSGQATNFCTQCGTPTIPEDSFCQSCGAPTRTAAAAVLDADPITAPDTVL